MQYFVLEKEGVNTDEADSVLPSSLESSSISSLLRRVGAMGLSCYNARSFLWRREWTYLLYWMA
ncbi:hypothetical protein C8J23_14623 [Shewanella chilikensis]|uniref:Uncharacterized protein n=1 Tax=Shewanella chilikensis TaxID=558541 RepID=A0ABX5PIF1_9GAMM|nr:hypothetical protein C8J23_14623 [Shewanella chilikensis]